MRNNNYVDPCLYYLTPQEIPEYADFGQCKQPKNFSTECNSSNCPYGYSLEYIIRFRVQMVDFGKANLPKKDKLKIIDNIIKMK